MRKRTRILAGISATALLALVSVAVHEHSARRWATLQAVQVTPSGNDCRVSLSIDGTCGYQISRSGSRMLVVGLEGARAGNLVQTAQHYPSGLFQAYRLTSAKSEDGNPEVQIQIETRLPARFSIQNEGPSLGLVMKPLEKIDTLPPDSFSAANDLALLPSMKLFAAPGIATRSRTNLSSILIRGVAKGRTLVN
ncbi:MAG: hypothetical protein ACRD3T_02955, partial [Terriglobia bacterium]